MRILNSVCFLWLTVLCMAAHAQQKQDFPGIEISKLSEGQQYEVGYASKLKPIVINTMHTWIIHIKDRDGQPVSNVELSVVGGMPEHNHGLATRPQITQNFGDGNYLLEGMKFHMGGWWQVTISIREENFSDSVTFDLQL